MCLSAKAVSKNGFNIRGPSVEEIGGHFSLTERFTKSHTSRFGFVVRRIVANNRVACRAGADVV